MCFWFFHLDGQIDMRTLSVNVPMIGSFLSDWDKWRWPTHKLAGTGPSYKPIQLVYVTVVGFWQCLTRFSSIFMNVIPILDEINGKISGHRRRGGHRWPWTGGCCVFSPTLGVQKHHVSQPFSGKHTGHYWTNWDKILSDFGTFGRGFPSWSWNHRSKLWLFLVVSFAMCTRRKGDPYPQKKLGVTRIYNPSL